jgi:uncharacterized protein YecT (DUF1311 family)
MKIYSKAVKILLISLLAVAAVASCAFALSDSEYRQMKNVSKYFRAAEASMAETWAKAQRVMPPAYFQKLKAEQRTWLGIPRDNEAEAMRNSYDTSRADGYALATYARSNRIWGLMEWAKGKAKGANQDIYFANDLNYIIITDGKGPGQYKVHYSGQRWGGLKVFDFGPASFSDDTCPGSGRGNKIYVYDTSVQRAPIYTITMKGNRISVKDNTGGSYYGAGISPSGEYYKW